MTGTCLFIRVPEVPRMENVPKVRIKAVSNDNSETLETTVYYALAGLMTESYGTIKGIQVPQQSIEDANEELSTAVFGGTGTLDPTFTFEDEDGNVIVTLTPQ